MSKQNPPTDPIFSGGASATADEGRVLNIGISDIKGPITINPLTYTLNGPPCPAYDAHGKRIPATPAPNTNANFSGTIRIKNNEIPDPGTDADAEFTGKDNGYWTRCSQNQKVQFPQTVTVRLTIKSINLVLDKHFTTVCIGNNTNLAVARIYPATGGTVTYQSLRGKVIISNATNNGCILSYAASGTDYVIATLTVGTAVYRDTCTVEAGEIKFTKQIYYYNVPDTSIIIIPELLAPGCMRTGLTWQVTKHLIDGRTTDLNGVAINLRYCRAGEYYSVTASSQSNIQCYGYCTIILREGSNCPCSIDLPDNTYQLCPNQNLTITAGGTPTGGTYSWAMTPNFNNRFQIVSGANTNAVTVRSTDLDFFGASMTLTYTSRQRPLCQCSTTVYLQSNFYSVRDWFLRNVPNNVDAPLLNVPYNVAITNVPSGAPATFTWASSANVNKLASSTSTRFDFTLTSGSGGWIEVVMNYCGQNFTKRITVTGAFVKVEVGPDFALRRNNTLTSSAWGVPNDPSGTYQWTITGPATIVGGANTRTVSVRGDNLGTATLSCTYSIGGLSDTKSVRVRVFDSISLSLSPCPWWICDYVGPYPQGTNVNATVDPPGGTLSWTKANNNINIFNPGGNTNYVYISPVNEGNSSVSCIYSFQGLTVTKSCAGRISYLNRMVITPSDSVLQSGRDITFQVRVTDSQGRDVSNQFTYDWRFLDWSTNSGGNFLNRTGSSFTYQFARAYSSITVDVSLRGWCTPTSQRMWYRVK